MDKQDAIDFIVQEFENDRSPSEIARSLSEMMGAPLDVVARFVNRTLEQRISFITPPASEATSASVIPPQPVAWEPPVKSGPPDELQEPDPYASPALLIEDDPSAGSGAAAVEAVASPVEAGKAPAISASAEIDPRLEKFILASLAKDRKQSDVVMAVCERAGMGWDEAQRLVARVNAKHHKKIVARRNRIMIPFALGFVAVGLGLAYAGFSDLVRLAPFLQALNESGVQNAFQALPTDLSRRAFWALALGTVLMLSGIVGLVKAFRAGME